MDHKAWKRVSSYVKQDGKKIARDVKSGKARIQKGSRVSKADRWHGGEEWSDEKARKLRLVRRRSLVARLRTQGLSFNEIARVVRKTLRDQAPEGYDRQLVRTDLEQYLDTVHQGTVDEVRRMRSLELMRMDWLTSKLFDMIETTTLSVGRGIELYLKVSERRAKLAGLDSPTQVDARLFGDIHISYGFDTTEYDDADKDPMQFVDGDYEVKMDGEEETALAIV